MTRAGPQPRRCLVTGGAGFIGSHLVECLLAGGDSVTVIDDLSTGRRSNLDAARRSAGGRLREVIGDLGATLAGTPISNPDHRYDEVYHLAAAVGVKRVVERPVESIETNVIQTAAVLKHAAAHRDAGVEPPRVLIASSSEVYGKASKSPFSEEDDVVYGPTSVLRWSYACSKAIDEHLAIAHNASGRVPTAVVRLFNTVGPRQVGEYGMVLPNFVRAALAGEDLVVHGDGKQSRCFCDVRDIAPILPKVLREPRCLGGVFNVGSDRPISIIELAELVIRTLGSRSRTRLVSYSDAYRGGVGTFEDLRQRQPDLTRLRAAVGFAATIGLEQTIRDVAAEMRGSRVRSGGTVSAEVG